MKTSSTSKFSLAVLVATAPLSAQTWFDLDASRPREQLVLSSKALTVTKVGTIVDSTTHLVLGKGYYEVLNFDQPSVEPWYISARFRLDQYGDSLSFYISSLAGTATWPNSEEGMSQPLQGFELRIGGGRFYPQMGYNSLVTPASHNGALDYFQGDRNAFYSGCLLDFVMGTSDDSVEWAESYSSRCVERGVWHHIAAGWDGKQQILFLDGHNVLDTNRINGKGIPPRLDTPAQLYIGHRRRVLGTDQRYFHGAVQSIRMVSGVLDSVLASQLYRQAFPPVQGMCDAVPVVDYPLTFQFAFADEMARMSLVRSPKCAEGQTADLQLHPGDSIEVMAVVDTTGKLVDIIKVGSLEFPLSSFVNTEITTQTIRLKARLRRKASAVAARTMADSLPPWNDDRPIVITGKALGVRERAARSAPARLIGTTSAVFPEASGLVARDPEGRVVALGSTSRRADGAWDLSALPRGFWVVSGGGATLRFVRF